MTEYANRSDRFGRTQHRDVQEGQGMNKVDRSMCVVRKERRTTTGYCVMEVESMIEGDSDPQGEIRPKGQERSGLRGVPWRSV